MNHLPMRSFGDLSPSEHDELEPRRAMAPAARTSEEGFAFTPHNWYPVDAEAKEESAA